MGTTYAVLIGIETYQKQGISSVQFAQADAAAMKDLLVQELGVPAENITVWLDFEATKSVFENDLPYLIRQLAPGDRFIFFYAGHGFFANGTNRLTTWDTHPGNLAGTTVSLEGVLLKPLKDQQGADSLVFMDACAADLKTSLVQARDIVSDLTPSEFEALVRSTDHSAAFFACSPNQKAYPSDALQHGIWTYHLIQALQGDAEGALDRDRWITGDSLKNYLAVAVPAYVRENTTIQAEQRPYAILSSNGPFGIHQAPPSDATNPASPESPATTTGIEAKLTPEQSQTPTSGNRPQIMLSTVEGHYNQWKGDVFKEIGTGFSSAQWLGHPSDTFDLIPNGRSGSVLVCRGGKTTKPRVLWKTHDSTGRLRDRDLDLSDGYPSWAEIMLMDSSHRPLLRPIVLDVTESGGEFSVSARQ
jgi:Caspase domain